MKISLPVLLLIVVVSTSCRTRDQIKSLPKTDELITSTRGAYIEVLLVDKQKFNGELIAVHADELFVLDQTTSNLHQIKLNELKKYDLTYAKSAYNYNWSIPVLSALTLSHGFFLILTLPTTLTTTSFVSHLNTQGHAFNEANLPLEELYKFARFPQGIPSAVPLHAIK